MVQVLALSVLFSSAAVAVAGSIRDAFCTRGSSHGRSLPSDQEVEEYGQILYWEADCRTGRNWLAEIFARRRGARPIR
jgi:hypothetical protein